MSPKVAVKKGGGRRPIQRQVECKGRGRNTFWRFAREEGGEKTLSLSLSFSRRGNQKAIRKLCLLLSHKAVAAAAASSASAGLVYSLGGG